MDYTTFPKGITPTIEAELSARINGHDLDDSAAAAMELAQRAMPIWRRIARDYNTRGIETKDLEQAAFIGAWRAANKFDVSRAEGKGVFKRFAEGTIRDELRLAVSTVDVHISQRAEKEFWKTAALSRKAGLPLADAIPSMTRKAQLAARWIANRADSLNATVTDADGRSAARGDFIASAEPTPERQLSDADHMANLVAGLLDGLTDTERTIAVHRILHDGLDQPRMTCEEVAEVTGKSKATISRAEARVSGELKRRATLLTNNSEVFVGK